MSQNNHDDDYQAGAPQPIEARPEQGASGRWTLVFTRQLKHPPERVWQALTDPAELRAWAPFDASRDLGRSGPAVLTMAGAKAPGPDDDMPAEVRVVERPRRLEYTWGEDLLRWELEPIPSGTRLTLYHTVTDRSWLSKVAAGWHICLDVAERNLAGDPVGRIVADQAMAHGWQRLNDGYAAVLGKA
jgi:uncharacterized protein YndB with AHSA1/START domain